MTQRSRIPFHDFNEDVALRTILEGTAKATGELFFATLVENLSKALSTHGAWVTEFIEESRQLRPLAFWMGDQLINEFKYDVTGTPCESVIKEARLIHIPERAIELYPGDPGMKKIGVVSYMGVPLLDLNGKILGHLAVLDTRPMPEEPRSLALFQIFAARAGAELQRLRAESEVREREEQLGRLVDSAMDAIIKLDKDLKIVMMNSAAEKVFRCTASQIRGQDFTRFISNKDREKLRRLIGDLDALPEGQRYLWIPGGLQGVRSDGNLFPAEATLSRFEMHREVFYSLILRNVNERLEAEQRIQLLTNEAQYLREEIKSLHNFDEIIGRSKPLLRVLRDIEQVAGTDTTVLFLGETGTGKEVMARAVHGSSQRREKSFIKVNCAAIPAALIESEFFGHEKGAFTGATKRRDGRFALADGGTIFLDEVGELTVDLQAKFLRVLQEGEFEPVGSSHTRKVNIRVIAATNRDLSRAVKDGNFREDLYYRLNVFPIQIPPLRDRTEDIPLLASSFVERFARRMGRKFDPFSEECIQRLKACNWPGNVRELENVIERAVITSQDGRLNLDRALPETAGAKIETTESTQETSGRICTAQELEELERNNIRLALEKSGWQVSGEDGAARLLGMNPSTLSSRIKALGIKRSG
jgi:PAS domain S-box-containing protein